MKEARQHGKPALSAAEELRLEVRDAELDVTGQRRPRGGAGDALTPSRHAQEAAAGSEPRRRRPSRDR